MEGQEEQKPAGSGSRQPAPQGRGRLLAAYAIVAVVALIAIVAIIVLSSGSDSAARGNPHINLDSGITNGIAPESRVGIEPPVFEEQNLQAAARAADCELRLRLPEEGDEHIPASAPEPRYQTNPPTSGDHVDEQQADGAYRETPPPVSVVHSLEHGRLAIQYRPDLPERAQLELIGLFDTMYGGTLLFPNPDTPYSVVATTWTNLLGCRSHRGALTLSAIGAFGMATWGKFGGEPVVAIATTLPTPTRPLQN
ncbi:MAG TPA: DUF3105 domain-containing protein [Solirubrobacterales bacterium]|nr:DUF3105 domain-containing protein [Solirubrobacterales bacterium]